ncbi:MAG: hypothetical protein DRQ44_14920 [Gammaproteobacteria bacterium]|nr:MAG: hypothetical protein DRQ44_14920 [Gammaproteobacteria bacterium]
MYYAKVAKVLIMLSLGMFSICSLVLKSFGCVHSCALGNNTHLRFNTDYKPHAGYNGNIANATRDVAKDASFVVVKND